jgi:hypothetical protein
MPSKRRPTSTRSQPRGRAKKATGSGLGRRLDELTERIDIVLPEMTARVAALEHVLLELSLCTRDDLRRAREFVRDQEA